MSSFIVDLWESVFTPGPTPTLLKAANISFAALQVVLFALLLATYSIHCIVLSVLCAGLWWSVNWFAAELAVHQARERAEAAKRPVIDPSQHPSSSSSEDEAGEETEVETAAPPNIIPELRGAAEAGVEVIAVPPGLKHRSRPVSPPRLTPHPPAPGTQSSVSTEDEWEKVSESENDKDKDK